MPSGTLSAPIADAGHPPGKRARTASTTSAASTSKDIRAPSTPATPRLPSTTSAAASLSQPQSRRESWGNPPRVSSASRSASASASAVTPTRGPTSDRARSDEDDEEAKERWELRRIAYSQLSLAVCQQPERARLCSFKEENETIDRRPVDPPPVLELLSRDGEYPDLLDSTQFFIRASLVEVEPMSIDDNGKITWKTVTTNSGAEATAGDVIQTPERLRHLDGSAGALCIFAKLSVRMPGWFRLKFTLYETAPDGLSEITDTVSEKFEVFSPKQFKGMHESTPLTRHLATQGLKVKLRPGHDSQGGKGNKRRASNNSQFSRQQYQSPPSDALSPAPHSAPVQHPSHLRYSQGMVPRPGPGSAPPYAQPTRGLVWPAHFPSSYPGYPEHELAGPSSARRSPSAVEEERPRKVRRSMGHDDGGFALHDISSRLDLSLPSPSSDLSQFSLGNRRPQSSSSAPPPSRHDWRRDYPPGDDGIPHLVLSPPPPQYPSSSRAPPPPPPPPPHAQEFAYPRLPRIVSASSHHRHHPQAHRHHHEVAHPPHDMHLHHAPPSHSQLYSQSHPHSYSHHYSQQPQHRSSPSPSSYSHHPRALGRPHAQQYHSGPPSSPASHSQYPPASPPPVLPPIRHSRSRSPSVPRHYDRDSRT